MVSLVSGLQIYWNPRRLDITGKRSTFMQSLILTKSLGISSCCEWDTVRFSISLDRVKGLGKTVGEEKRFRGSLDNFPLHELAPFSSGKFGYQFLIFDCKARHQIQRRLADVVRNLAGAQISLRGVEEIKDEVGSISGKSEKVRKFNMKHLILYD